MRHLSFGIAYWFEAPEPMRRMLFLHRKHILSCVIDHACLYNLAEDRLMRHDFSFGEPVSEAMTQSLSLLPEGLEIRDNERLVQRICREQAEGLHIIESNPRICLLKHERCIHMERRVRVKIHTRKCSFFLRAIMK